MRKVAVIDGGTISLREEPVPAPGKGELLIEVECSLISPGTELGGVRAQREKANKRSNTGKSSPRPFGYQDSGIVAGKGSGCDEFDIGDRVAALGAGYALHATHACVPKNLCVPLPEGISFAEGAFGNLAGTALHAIRRARLELGENVMVFGLGLVGQLTGQLAQIAGAHVLGVDPLDSRRDIAVRAGIKDVLAPAAEEPDEADFSEAVNEFSHGYGIDCAFICFGGDASQAVKTAARVMKTAPDTHQYGRIVIVGGVEITQRFPVPLGNIDVLSSSRSGPGYHDRAYERGAGYPAALVPWTVKRNLDELMRLIACRKLDVKTLITDQYPLDRVAEACEKLIEHPEQSLGVILRPKL